MRKVYYLGSCDTCKKIISKLRLKEKTFEFQEIKSTKITEQQLQELKELAGSYEALFSRSSRKYKELGLAAKTLSETDYKNYILSEYTFLKRPVIVNNKKIFVGNSVAVINAADSEINQA